MRVRILRGHSSLTSSRIRAGAAPALWSSSVYHLYRNAICSSLLTLMVLACAIEVDAQKKTRKKPAAPAPVTELAKLREQYVQATKDYKASLEKLLTFYEADVKKA